MGEIFQLRSMLKLRSRLTFDVAFDYAIGLLVCGSMDCRELQMRLRSFGCGDSMACDVIDEIARNY